MCEQESEGKFEVYAGEVFLLLLLKVPLLMHEFEVAVVSEAVVVRASPGDAPLIATAANSWRLLAVSGPRSSTMDCDPISLAEEADLVEAALCIEVEPLLLLDDLRSV